MTESERRAIMREVPILAGFLSTLLEDIDWRERGADNATGSDDTIYTCPDATFEAAADICREWFARAEPWILASNYSLGADDYELGADLYLTAAGHGSGLWDKPRKINRRDGELISDMVRRIETYVGDDGHVYIG